MNTCAPNLFASWPGDKLPAELPKNLRVASLFHGLCERARTDLQWIAETVKSIKQHDDKDIFDLLYRRNHVLCGFATVLGLPKIAHTLSLLDFTFDYTREIGSFGKRPMDYVVHLLVETTRNLFDDFLEDGRSGRDISDVVLECRSYLQDPIQYCLAPPPVTGEKTDRRPEETVAAYDKAPEPVPSQRAVDAKAAFAPLPVSNLDEADALEELDIPVDKVGLVSDFCEESRENLEQIGQQLVLLENSTEPLPLINQVFRAVHTVKGGARLLKIRKMETLAHQLESSLDQVRAGSRPVSARLIDVLLEGKKLLERMVDEVASRGPIRTRIVPVLKMLAGLQDVAPQATEARPAVAEQATPSPGQASVMPDKPSPGQASVMPDKPSPAEERDKKTPSSLVGESIRIPIEKLDDVLNTASEVFIARIRLQSDVAAIGNAVQQFQQTLQRMQKLDPAAILTRLAESNRRLVKDLLSLANRKNGLLTADRFSSLVYRFHDELNAEIERQSYSAPEEVTLNLLSVEEIRTRLQKNVEHLEQLSGHLQTGAMSFRMVPMAHLFRRFPTLVRELARQMGKKVKLTIRGADTELDTVLINRLADPLLHILRNAVDHGLESPEERQALGKPETGQIALCAYYHGSHAVIEVTDDGPGIDADKVLARAVERGLVEAEHAASITEQELFSLLFEPGFSTSDTVSTLSGRGVGMDVVKTVVTQMQGSINIDSTPHQGTTVRMNLPLTLAVVGILLVEERFNQFAFPILHVHEILTLDRKDIQQLSHSTVYNYRGTALPLTTLSSLLDFPPSAFAADQVSLVILTDGEKKIGVMVDRVLGRQEVLIKNLGSLLKRVPFVMGCTILSDSRLVLILNAWEIVNTRGGSRPLAPSLDASDLLRSARKPQTVLIIDDSAIQRNHLRAIVDHAGYGVEIAENGFHALKRVGHRSHAAFCVDVVMPLMDGFEFVERLRRLPEHRRTPVIFITNRTEQADRERASRLGVLEFFTKPVEAERLIETLDAHCLHAEKEISL